MFSKELITWSFPKADWEEKHSSKQRPKHSQKTGFFTLTHPRPSTAVLKLQQARRLAPDFPLEQQRAPRQGIFLGAEQDITPRAEQTRVGNALPTELLLSALPAHGSRATSHIQGDLRGSGGCGDGDGQGISHLEMLIPHGAHRGPAPTPLWVPPTPLRFHTGNFGCGLTNLLISRFHFIHSYTTGE